MGVASGTRERRSDPRVVPRGRQLHEQLAGATVQGVPRELPAHDVRRERLLDSSHVRLARRERRVRVGARVRRAAPGVRVGRAARLTLFGGRPTGHILHDRELRRRNVRSRHDRMNNEPILFNYLLYLYESLLYTYSTVIFTLHIQYCLVRIFS